MHDSAETLVATTLRGVARGLAVALAASICLGSSPGAAVSAAPASHPAASTTTTPAQGEKLYFDACPGFGPDHPWDHYHDYQEVVAFLRSAAAAHPDLTALESIGTSYEGRDLWLLTVTDAGGGAVGEKPAVWVDGGIDADEVIGVEAALYLAWKLLVDPGEHADLLRRRTFYVAPAVIPDTTEIHMTTPIRPRDSTARPWDDDGDGARDEDPADDLDGDDEALQMRRRHPTGDWVVSEEDPRLMRRRQLGDDGPFYRLYSEGVDDDGDGEINEDGPGGIDPNRNYPANWAPASVQSGSGPWPTSEVELRAMMDFFIS